MGYSIVTPIKNKKAKEKMMEFLQKNYRSSNEMAGVSGGTSFASAPTDEPSYRGGKKTEVIGINYTGFGLDREYAFEICQWISLMIGKTSRSKKYAGRPYILYDGEESMYLFVNEKVGENEEGIEVDEYGFHTTARMFVGGFPEGAGIEEKIQKADELIKNELIRLTQLWKGEEMA